ncbi:unknown [Bacteroides sp. CAG:1060]|nr:unknown [Bacteroides sp. CAG:1060]
MIFCNNTGQLPYHTVRSNIGSSAFHAYSAILQITSEIISTCQRRKAVRALQCVAFPVHGERTGKHRLGSQRGVDIIHRIGRTCHAGGSKVFVSHPGGIRVAGADLRSLSHLRSRGNQKILSILKKIEPSAAGAIIGPEVIVCPPEILRRGIGKKPRIPYYPTLY